MRIFKYVIMHEDDLEVLEEYARFKHRTLNARHWFADHDNILKPIWEYIFQTPGPNTVVNQARDRFRLLLSSLLHANQKPGRPRQ